ncbi:thiamine pyrophosphate-dependent enzyme [Helcococcus ovis]
MGIFCRLGTKSVRMLPLNGKQKYIMSGWFATLGYSTPAAIGGKL